MKHNECYKDSFVKVVRNGTTGMDAPAGMAQITEVGRADIEIQFANSKEKVRYFAAHLHQDADCIRQHRKWREQRAQKIGGRYINEQAMR